MGTERASWGGTERGERGNCSDCKINKYMFKEKQNMVRPIIAIPQSLGPTFVLVRASINAKRHNDKYNYYKVQYLSEVVAYRF